MLEATQMGRRTWGKTSWSLAGKEEGVKIFNKQNKTCTPDFLLRLRVAHPSQTGAQRTEVFYRGRPTHQCTECSSSETNRWYLTETELKVLCKDIHWQVMCKTKKKKKTEPSQIAREEENEKTNRSYGIKHAHCKGQKAFFESVFYNTTGYNSQ